MSLDGAEWHIDDVRVDGVAVPTPDPTRGQEVRLTCTFWPGSGGTDGHTGATYPHLYPSLFASAVGSHRARYRALREYLRWATGDHIQVWQTNGAIRVSERRDPHWTVDSHIVPVDPGDGVPDNPGFWGAIMGGSDQSEPRTTGGPRVLQLQVVVLADLDEFGDRDELTDALGPDLNITE